MTLHPDDAIPELSTAEKAQVGNAVGAFPLVGDIKSGVVVVYGGHVNVGSVASTSETEKVHVLVLFAQSVALHAIYVVPSNTLMVLEVLHEEALIPDASEGVGLTKEYGADVFTPLDGVTIAFNGHVMVGAEASRTVTLNEQEALLLALSVALQLTVDVVEI